MSKMELSTGNKNVADEVRMTIDLLTKIESLPANRKHDELVRQLLRYSFSIGTNYETASRSKSAGDFINKLKKKEIDNKKTTGKLKILLNKANQLLSIYTSDKGFGENKHRNYTHQ